MRIFVSIAICVAVLLCRAAELRAVQSSPASLQAAASTLTGRLTIDNQGAPGIAVALQPANGSWPLPSPVARATTDNEGHFRMTNLTAGRYFLIPLAPAYYAPSEDRMIASGKTVTIMKGENIDGIELSLTPGGVITGLVTTAGGSPLIGREVHPFLTDMRGQQSSSLFFRNGRWRFKTDDRGVYRIYGLPPGRYIVSVQTDARGQRVETFHPNVTERTKADPIEVLAGKVVENVDIKLPPMTNRYELSGRVVDVATGQPIPGMKVNCLGGGYHRGSSLPLNERGEFNFNDLAPGRYTIFIPVYSLSEYYSDELNIEVIDQDSSGIEIKARRAASLSGRVVIEGVSDTSILSDLSHLSISVSKFAGGGFSADVQAGADGRFRIPGLPPDRFRLSLSSRLQRQKFRLLGVERDGVWQQPGIDVVAGEQINGLRVIVAYGAGVVNGRVQVIGGSLPENVRFDVTARRTDIPGMPDSALGVRSDMGGRFLLEGLATGKHEITLTPVIPFPSGGTQMTRWPQIKQTISVTGGDESEVTFVMDLNPKNRKEE